MKTVIAIVSCIAVFVGYIAILVGLGQQDLVSGPNANIATRIGTLAPLMLLIGAVWSGITGKGFPKDMDPLGIVSRKD